MSELVVARIVAALFAAAGALGLTLQIGGVTLDQDGTTKAATVVVMAVGAIYGAVRTWRRGRLAPTSKHAIDPGAPPPAPAPPLSPAASAIMRDIGQPPGSAA